MKQGTGYVQCGFGCLSERLRGYGCKRAGSKGFTLVELLVVLVIMGILTAAILPVVTGYVSKAQVQVSESNVHMVEQAARLYLTNWEMTNAGATTATVTASELVTAGYLSPLPEGEDYTVNIAKVDGVYTVTVVPGA